MKATDPNYIAVKDAAEEFSIHPDTIRRYVSEGLIADSYKLGLHKKLYIARKDLVKILSPRKEDSANA